MSMVASSSWTIACDICTKCLNEATSSSVAQSTCIHLVVVLPMSTIGVVTKSRGSWSYRRSVVAYRPRVLMFVVLSWQFAGIMYKDYVAIRPGYVTNAVRYSSRTPMVFNMFKTIGRLDDLWRSTTTSPMPLRSQSRLSTNWKPWTIGIKIVVSVG